MVLDILLLGLSEFIEKNNSPRTLHFAGKAPLVAKHPLPELLCEAMDRLAVASLVATPPSARFPHTLTGFLEQCKNPTGAWWPRVSGNQDLTLPTGFECVPLLENGVLSEEASERLHDALDSEDLSGQASTRAKKSGLENALMRDLIRKLRDEADSNQAEHEYRIVRRFLIEHPFPTIQEIQSLKSSHKLHLVSNADIGAFYDDHAGIPPLWQCTQCGPLLDFNGQLLGLKPEACSDHWDSTSHVHKIEGEAALGRRRLKLGIHLRTLIPGIPELRLFDWLQKQQIAHSSLLREVTLWPGVDRYDYRIVWSDGEVWGVDFKDYKSPQNLGRKLKRLPNRDPWNHDDSFYVFPARHLSRHPNYKQLALDEAEDLPLNLQLISDKEFEARVQERLTQLKIAEHNNKKSHSQKKPKEDPRDV